MHFSLHSPTETDPALALAIERWPRLPPEIKRMVASWPDLPDAITAALLALATAACPNGR